MDSQAENYVGNEIAIGSEAWQAANAAYPRVSNETPRDEALCLVAPSVRLSVRAIFDAGVF
jgi:hypothetical protein